MLRSGGVDALPDSRQDRTLDCPDMAGQIARSLGSIQMRDCHPGRGKLGWTMPTKMSELKPAAQRDLRIQRRTNRRLMSRVRIREIGLVGQILDIELDPEIVGNVVERRGVYPCIARQDGRIAIIDEALILIGEAEAQPELVGHLVGIPEREHVLWQLARAKIAARLFAVEIAITARNKPLIRNLSLQLDFETSDLGFDEDLPLAIGAVFQLRRALFNFEDRCCEA